MLSPVRHIKRCCWVTWVVFVLVSLALTLIVVPGDLVTRYQSTDGIDRSGWSEQLEEAIKRKYSADKLPSNARLRVDQYQHGWPLSCMTRGIGRVVRLTRVTGPARWKDNFTRGHPRSQPHLSLQLPNDGDSFTPVSVRNSNSIKLVPTDRENTPLWWSDYNRWPLAIDHTEWRFGRLLLNLAVMLAILLIASAAVELWTRRRGGAMRFRLVDLMMAFVVCSVVFAWYRSHADLRRTEQKIEATGSPFLFRSSSFRDAWELREKGESNFNCYRREYFGPDWLRRLLGNREFLRFSKHMIGVQLIPNDSWQANLRALAGLDYLEFVSLPMGVNQELISQLERLPRLKEIQVSINTRKRQESIADQAGLSAKRWMGAADLDMLRSLSIERLSLCGEELLMEDIEKIVTMPTLTRLELVEASVSSSELKRLRDSHPQVEIVSAWGEQFWSTAMPGTHFSYSESPPNRVEWQIERIKHRRTADVGDH